jgi:hypothetical protein
MENRTEKELRRAARAEEGAKAWAEHVAERERVKANTQRLRKLRLSRQK